MSKKSSKLQRDKDSLDGNYQEVEFIEIFVTDPQKISDGKESFTRYKLSTETTFPQYRKREFSVYRRYNDFVNIRKFLSMKMNQKGEKAYQFGELPSLPGTTLGSLFGDGRYNPVFIEKRRKKLETFVNTVANHNFCRFEKKLHEFLQDEEYVHTT